MGVTGRLRDWYVRKMDSHIFDFRTERKKRSAIVGTLAEIVTTNKNKVSNWFQLFSRHIQSKGPIVSIPNETLLIHV